MRWTFAAVAILCCLALACGDDADQGTDDGDVAVPDTDAGTGGDGIDFDQFEAVGVRFTLAGEGLYRLPWPLDYRLGDDGTVDLAEFPREGVELFEKYIDALDGLVAGFSIMPVIVASAIDATAIGSEGTSVAALFAGGALIGAGAPPIAGAINAGAGFEGVVIFVAGLAIAGTLLSWFAPRGPARSA